MPSNELDFDFENLGQSQDMEGTNFTQRNFLIMKCLDYQRLDQEASSDDVSPKGGLLMLKRGKVFRYICKLASLVQDLPDVYEFFRTKYGTRKIGYMKNCIHPEYAMEYVLHVQFLCQGASDDRIQPIRSSAIK